MPQPWRIVIGTCFVAAFLFGFLHLLWPQAPFSFQRLHVFLFNLCSGGTILLHYARGGRRPSGTVIAYFLLSLAYALSAFFRQYLVTLVLSLPLAFLVESVRIRRFSLFPWDFFRGNVPVRDKFQQASLLCLSTGILIASLVILNNVYLKLVTLEKLTLDVFFLGYSFPVSLMTMSVMFSFLPEKPVGGARVVQEAAFWIINLGVIVFFTFIIFKLPAAEFSIAILLFGTVCMVFVYFLDVAPSARQKRFLLSGAAFLLVTALTGVLYFVSPTGYGELKPRSMLLTLHGTVSLYGWNMAGLLVMLRWGRFPARLGSTPVILLHWCAVFVLAPAGKYILPLAAVTLPLYLLLLGIGVLSPSPRKEASP